MNKNVRNILCEKITILNLTKKEIFWRISKSISQNNNIHNKIKIYKNYLYSKKIKKNSFFTKKHKVCLYTGKRSSVLNKSNFSRYTLKSLILQNKFTNIKKYNW